MSSATGKVSDRKSTRLNSSHVSSSYAVFCLKKKTSRPDTVEHVALDTLEDWNGYPPSTDVTRLAHRHSRLQHRRPLMITLFPYTTLFRSRDREHSIAESNRARVVERTLLDGLVIGEPYVLCHGQSIRSEEHTSELQSRFELVCRLLLEKKNFPPGHGRTRRP